MESKTKITRLSRFCLKRLLGYSVSMFRKIALKSFVGKYVYQKIGRNRLERNMQGRNNSVHCAKNTFLLKIYTRQEIKCT